MGRLPGEVRALTPKETSELVDAWNAAQSAASGELPPPTIKDLEELEARYG
ncbi:hypothetical protein AQS8620_01298 [Aquimixticola soesokkakensis]|uniref:Addiction module component n=1 Tax=Aquimixticola soesokkakensis TaxID=1519096 RepID=A0A1Y5SDA6_9RHOB|nr:hypothetical protein AQS8620_01298 [Aquimixticola soesokkakensis]